ncbi:MAG TPA: hypothetical protein VGE45_10850 [Chloroflexia bacterium]|jgi:hypothetical protein
MAKKKPYPRQIPMQQEMPASAEEASESTSTSNAWSLEVVEDDLDGRATALASEAVLSKYWLNPEEDEAWRDLLWSSQA